MGIKMFGKKPWSRKSHSKSSGNDFTNREDDYLKNRLTFLPKNVIGWSYMANMGTKMFRKKPWSGKSHSKSSRNDFTNREDVYQKNRHTHFP